MGKALGSRFRSTADIVIMAIALIKHVFRQELASCAPEGSDVAGLSDFVPDP